MSLSRLALLLLLLPELFAPAVVGTVQAAGPGRSTRSPRRTSVADRIIGSDTDDSHIPSPGVPVTARPGKIAVARSVLPIERGTDRRGYRRLLIPSDDGREPDGLYPDLHPPAPDGPSSPLGQHRRRDSTAPEGSAGTPTAAVVGGVVGSLAVLALLGFAIFFVWYRGRKELKREELRLRYQSSRVQSLSSGIVAGGATWPPSLHHSATALTSGRSVGGDLIEGPAEMAHDDATVASPPLPSSGGGKYWGPWSISTAGGSGTDGSSERLSYGLPPLTPQGRASTITPAPGSDGLILDENQHRSSLQRHPPLPMAMPGSRAMPMELEANDMPAISRVTTASSKIDPEHAIDTTPPLPSPPPPPPIPKQAPGRRSVHVGLLVRPKQR